DGLKNTRAAVFDLMDERATTFDQKHVHPLIGEIDDHLHSSACRLSSTPYETRPAMVSPRTSTRPPWSHSSGWRSTSAGRTPLPPEPDAYPSVSDTPARVTCARVSLRDGRDDREGLAVDDRAVEVLERARRGRATLALVARLVVGRPVRFLGR